MCDDGTQRSSFGRVLWSWWLSHLDGQNAPVELDTCARVETHV